jgi:hypothetical protein
MCAIYSLSKLNYPKSFFFFIGGSATDQIWGGGGGNYDNGTLPWPAAAAGAIYEPGKEPCKVLHAVLSTFQAFRNSGLDFSTFKAMLYCPCDAGFERFQNA